MSLMRPWARLELVMAAASAVAVVRVAPWLCLLFGGVVVGVRGGDGVAVVVIVVCCC